MVLVDTAGLRRRTKVAGTVDYYAQLRSERAAERADVAIVVCDATEGVTTEDLRIAELAMNKNCATVIALNKWDVTETDLEDARARVATEAAPAPAGDGGVGQDAGAACGGWWPRRWPSPTAPPSASPRPS